MDELVLSARGPKVSALGLGCMGMSHGYGPADREASLAALRRSLDLGVRFWDTADTYGQGANESLINAALTRVNRDEVVIATKFGAILDPDTGAPVGVRGDPDYIRYACDASLNRLGVDHIDLYYQHFPDTSVPIEETVGAMADLVRVGKVRHLGLSNVTQRILRAAHTVHPIAAIQEEWSLFSRDPERALVPTCAELDIGVVAYSPLARGFLTGRVTSTDGLIPDDSRHGYPRFARGNAEHNAALLEPIRRVAADHDATLAGVALAWVARQSRQHGIAVVPIPGTRDAGRLAENVAALSIELTDNELASLDGIAERVAGDRMPELPPELERLVPKE